MSIIIGYVAFYFITRLIALIYVRQQADPVARRRDAETFVMCLAPVMSEIIIIGSLLVVLLEEALRWAVRGCDRLTAALAKIIAS